MNRAKPSRRLLAAASLVCLSTLAGLLAPSAPAEASEASLAPTPAQSWTLTDDLWLCDEDHVLITIKDDGYPYISYAGKDVLIPAGYEIIVGFDQLPATTIDFMFDNPSTLSVLVDGARTEQIVVMVDVEASHVVRNNLSTYEYEVKAASGTSQYGNAPTNTKITVQSNDSCSPPDLEPPIVPL